jgi:hypothetical protein
MTLPISCPTNLFQLMEILTNIHDPATKPSKYVMQHLLLLG